MAKAALFSPFRQGLNMHHANSCQALGCQSIRERHQGHQERIALADVLLHDPLLWQQTIAQQWTNALALATFFPWHLPPDLGRKTIYLFWSMKTVGLNWNDVYWTEE